MAGSNGEISHSTASASAVEFHPASESPVIHLPPITPFPPPLAHSSPHQTSYSYPRGRKYIAVANTHWVSVEGLESSRFKLFNLK
ncbi:hypothetical protein EVAR_40419_1 [Eumeta japonica]|uniref:Uncharacterized protein n=1 Tax=Eumeta variegata TaxID=151549 RepID=A0A4C1WCZ9_EUMVA|nr:hypothetical protein EVAR_40419_1 [Eumeta japonica]